MPNTSIKPESLKLIKQFTAKHKIINQGGVRFVDEVLDLIGTVRHAHVMCEARPKPSATLNQLNAALNGLKEMQWAANQAVINELELKERDCKALTHTQEAIEAVIKKTAHADYQNPRNILADRLANMILPQFKINLTTHNKDVTRTWNQVLEIIIQECRFTKKPPTVRWVNEKITLIIANKTAIPS